MVNLKTDEILQKLKSFGDPTRVEGMARYGINPNNNYGVSVTTIRDARMVACLIDDPKKVTEEQMENWVKDFDSWDICDHCCGTLFDKTGFAYQKIVEWSAREEEFVKRAGFALIAWLVLHDKLAEDMKFEKLLPLIKSQATDERNYVKKAVNWALRHIGKRNLALNKKALKTAFEIQKIDSKSARWIASDAIRELKSDRVQKRLQNNHENGKH